MEKHAVEITLIFDAFKILYHDDFDISWELFRILNFWKMAKNNGENDSELTVYLRNGEMSLTLNL